MDAENRASLHVAVLPWVCFSHLNPLFQLSKRIAELGHRVSFISTPIHIDKLASCNPDLPPLLRLIPLSSPDKAAAADPCTFRSVEDELDALEAPLAAFLRCTSPDWILFDAFFYWVPHVAAAARVSTVHVSLVGAAAHVFMWPVFAQFMSTAREDAATQGYGHVELEQLITPLTPERVPFLTSTRFAHRRHEARQVLRAIFDPTTSDVPAGYRVPASVVGCDAVAIRSGHELEGEWLALLQSMYGKPVLPLGYFPPNTDPAVGDSCNSGQANDWDEVSKWLGKREFASVVYVALGTQLDLKKEQAHEIARGLELSNLPFVWALRGESDGLLPEGFEGRTRMRGLVFRGWVSQVRILAHPSVGGFLTHCGWNSIVEALNQGLPLVLLPFNNDQGLNAKLLAEKKVGVEVVVDETDGSFTGADVSRALRLVVAEEEGEECRARAKDVREVLHKSEVAGNDYVKHFIEYLRDNRRAA